MANYSPEVILNTTFGIFSGLGLILTLVLAFYGRILLLARASRGYLRADVESQAANLSNNINLDSNGQISSIATHSFHQVHAVDSLTLSSSVSTAGSSTSDPNISDDATGGFQPPVLTSSVPPAASAHAIATQPGTVPVNNGAATVTIGTHNNGPVPGDSGDQR